jgi:hypothetical protein
MPSVMSARDIMHFLVANASPGLPPEALAEVFDRLIWCLADNGAEIGAVREQWLDGDDPQRVEIALAMNETFPFNGGEAMASGLDRIARRWPMFAKRCAEIAASWQRTMARSK